MKCLLLLFACSSVLAYADDVQIGPDGKPRYGHSVHGEAFDEGPRQAAVLLPGTGKIDFPITTKVPDAQKFFNQGVGQLHGFWYYEAERSFRQVAKLEPENAMAYVGLALSNLNNEKRTAEFVKEAVKRRAQASPREQAWIDAYNAYFADGKGATQPKRRALVKALEKMVFEFPDDIEAKAFLVFQIWDNSMAGLPIGSHTATEALAKEVLAKNPEHPGIHHYMIHMWNYEDDRRALADAAVLGQDAPGVAHMWHMPGHTFTRLKRYGDAAWQQEASARTDHRHMIESRIMPEQIHNYAHNNDWLVEDLGFIGRVRDAVDLAKNMIELPRMAPGTLLVGKDGYGENSPGYTMGRKRLLDTLLAWGRWEELLSLENTRYLEPAEDPVEDARRLRALAVAAFQSGQKAKGEEKLALFDKFIKDIRDQRVAEAEKVEAEQKKAGKSLDDLAKAVGEIYKKSGEKAAALERYRAEIRVYQALAENKSATEVKPLLDEAKDIAPLRASRIYLKIGDKTKALELAERAAKDTDGQVLALANLCDVQWRADKKDDARKNFEKLRPLCMQADLGESVFVRLKPIADDLKLSADWRPKFEWPKDSGVRPELSSLGPFRWHPYLAPSWEAVDQTGKTHSLADYKGKPTLLVFYLGSGCSHCVEQLNTLGPLTKDFTEAGINIVAVSTDTATDLNKTFVQAKDAQGFNFPIVADPTLAAFKAYRAYDDFENQPLHGTFLIDGMGRVRWQDISFQPFKNSKWLLGECKRLLALPSYDDKTVAGEGEGVKSASVK